MAVNQQLEDAVLDMMAKQLLEKDPNLNDTVDGELDGAKAVIQAMGRVAVDEDYKFRFHYTGFIGYGYDFSKNDAKQTYNRAVENTRKRLLGNFGETLLHDEVRDDKIGLYLTQI